MSQMEQFFGVIVMWTCSDMKILQSCFLFLGESEDSLADFLHSEYCEIMTFAKGDTVFGEEKSRERLGLLLSGRATALCADGAKSALKTFTKGELFGAASVFCENSSLPFSKIKAAAACRVLFITREGVERLIYSEPTRAVEYIRFLCGRVEFLNRRISTFTSKEATERLAKHILQNAEDDLCENVNFTALAKTLDISRASLYRARNELENSGAIRIDGKNIVIVHRDALKNI